MLFDTDILIWIQRGNLKAASLVDKTNERVISVLTYMELLQCAQNREHHNNTRSFIRDLNFITLPLAENIGHRASIYIEEYSLSSGLRSGDAIIAATAAEHNLVLATGNVKHFKAIADITLHKFRP